MKNFKRILCLALTLLMAMSIFCACGGETPEESSDAEESGSVTVDVLGQDSTDSESEQGEENTEKPEDGFRARILLVTDTHYCHETYLGADMDYRMDHMVQDINEEHAKDPISMILFLGDYSLDHWKWQVGGSWVREQKSYTKMFLDKYKHQLPDVPMFFLAGNHEQYGEELWQEIVGNSRQGTMVMGDYLFIMWDSYGGELDPNYHHDGVYTPMDVAWVRAQMDAHPDKAVFLVSHHISIGSESDEAKALIADDRVICLFVGHDHSSKLVRLGAECGYKTVVHCGNYSQKNGADKDPGEDMWGFRELILTEDRIVTEYIVPANYYSYGGNTYYVKYHKQTAFTASVKQ